MPNKPEPKKDINTDYVRSSGTSRHELAILEEKLRKMSPEATAFIRARFYSVD